MIRGLLLYLEFHLLLGSRSCLKYVRQDGVKIDLFVEAMLLYVRTGISRWEAVLSSQSWVQKLVFAKDQFFQTQVKDLFY